MSVRDIRWRIPGGGECRDCEAWCYAFVRDMKGNVWPEIEEMIELIDQSYAGIVIDGEYEISLSPDGRFLNRRRYSKSQKVEWIPLSQVRAEGGR